MYNILIVDDANLMRTMIKNNLSTLGQVTLMEAENGSVAVEKYKQLRPNLVTMDITMDVKNGVDAAREILQFDPDARIIMVTALGQKNLLRECVSMGVQDFIVKPFARDRLISAVKKAIAA